jgi:hypothetical protein
VNIAIIGLISEQYADGIHALSPGVTIESADVALKRLMPQIAARSDVRILIYHGSKAEAEALAKQFEGIHLVLCAHEGDEPSAVLHVGACGLMSAGEDGKRVAAIQLDPNKHWRAMSSSIVLTPDYADDKDILDAKKSYLLRVDAERLLDKTPRIPTADGAAFVGSRACARCHIAADAAWRASNHSRALATLQREGENHDPDCVKCHVVGLEQQTGFASHEKTPHLEDVGCESCHGPGSKNIADPKHSLGKAGSASCAPCHVVEHSPRFEFDPYWSKIAHVE